MGVSGVGKTTVGSRLARRLGWAFLDADDFHPPANVEKMSQGIALTDRDRQPWLDAIAAALEHYGPAVLACSALKESYRYRLVPERTRARWVWLTGSAETITQRMAQRSEHFMPVELLRSQLATLEPPKEAAVLDIEQPPSALVDSILDQYPELASLG